MQHRQTGNSKNRQFGYSVIQQFGSLAIEQRLTETNTKNKHKSQLGAQQSQLVYNATIHTSFNVVVLVYMANSVVVIMMCIMQHHDLQADRR